MGADRPWRGAPAKYLTRRGLCLGERPHEALFRVVDTPCRVQHELGKFVFHHGLDRFNFMITSHRRFLIARVDFLKRRAERRVKEEKLSRRPELVTYLAALAGRERASGGRPTAPGRVYARRGSISAHRAATARIRPAP